MKRGLRVAAGVVALGAAATAALCGLAGCSGLAYYAQSAEGHLSLMARARPVGEWLADAQTPQDLRERLALAQRMRDFAVKALGLPDNRSYRAYADLGRTAAVWNVVAAPELSLKLKTWCFPVVGCVGYRGYYAREAAEAKGAALRAEGLEVAVNGVPAYSTLGWLDWLGGDPLLNTFIRYPEGELARMIFHELAHQVVYADGDTAFNESFATAVERLGGERWLRQHGSAEAREEYAAFDARRRDFRALSLRTRQALDDIYTNDAPEGDKRTRKAEAMAAFRADYEALKRERWGGYAGFDGFVARANNASLAIQGAYADGVPAFERLFEREGRDFARFYAEVKRLAALPKAERQATLNLP